MVGGLVMGVVMAVWLWETRVAYFRKRATHTVHNMHKHEPSTTRKPLLRDLPSLFMTCQVIGIRMLTLMTVVATIALK